MLSLRRLFEEMGEKNVVTWTSLMVGYSSNGDPEEAVNVYCRMRREGVACNQNYFAIVISSCGLLEDLLLCHQVLANAVVSGFKLSISVSNSIISMFGGFGCAEEASRVFNRMEERDTISWNPMISAYSRNELCQESFRCFHYMRHSKVKPDSTTLSSLVSACSSEDNLNGGRGVHDLVAKIGLDSNVCVCNALLSFYADVGKCKDAELLFREMPKKDLISWNSMMSSYVQNGEYLVALKLFIGLLGTSKIRNHVTFASALAACSARESLNEGKLVHALIIQAGLHKNLVVRNALVTMYGKCGIMREAKRVFQMMYERDRVTWNALIGGYTENEDPKEAINTFILMRQDGMTVNYITVINVLGSCLIPENLKKYGRPIHGYTVLSGLERDSYVQNSLLTMYAKCGDLDSSKFIFDGLANKNVVSWNAIIAANAHHGSGEEALKYVLEIHRTGLEFDQFSFSGGLAASSSLGLLQVGQQLHNMIIKQGFESDLHVINAAMDMYGKCGEMLDVLQILPTSKDRSRLSWNILISGFSRHGGFQKARERFIKC
ncbi:hypothetical protein GIB67_021531 [Kingdonia uniflora]|uniref:Pentatricopeptide repeat-containing protein n=1 Tax=Kingdonia uniflora TaxID=39325 RepID=A0A7J7L9J5_9MAGN|nr:hypothetical protein GIB67_021531 [Kingdonia uniflora]